MKKIIDYKIYRQRCDCGCLFEYDVTDIYLYDYTYHVKCPMCDRQLKHKEDYFKGNLLDKEDKENTK